MYGTLERQRFQGALFPPLRPQAKGESPRVNDVIHVDEMGPGTLVRTPVPCARVMMTLASRGKLPQIMIIIRVRY